jgi:hypothetical protein
LIIASAFSTPISTELLKSITKHSQFSRQRVYGYRAKIKKKKLQLSGAKVSAGSEMPAVIYTAVTDYLGRLSQHKLIYFKGTRTCSSE